MKTIEQGKKDSTISIMKYKADNVLLLPPESRKGFTIGDMDKSFVNGVAFAQHWIIVEDDLPEKLKTVFVKCDNNGKIYTTTAQFIPPESVLSSDFLIDDYDTDDCSEYNEDIDDYYVVSGWWEHQTEVDVNWKISSKVTHWRKIEIV